MTCILVWLLVNFIRVNIPRLLQLDHSIEQGCIINFKFIFLPPSPLSWFIFVPQIKFIIMMWSAPQAKIFKFFICNFVNIKSIGWKICILFTNWGKMHIFIPFQTFFFPQHDIFFFFGGGGESNRKINTLQYNLSMNLSFRFKILYFPVLSALCFVYWNFWIRAKD